MVTSNPKLKNHLRSVCSRRFFSSYSGNDQPDQGVVDQADQGVVDQADQGVIDQADQGCRGVSATALPSPRRGLSG